MTGIVKILPHYTYNDWVHWEGRWELIDGIPYARSPMPVPKHQRIASALRAELHIALKKCRSCIAYDPLDYKLSDDTILQPDILVVCGKINKKYLDFPPSLIVEILSPSTALKDRHTKFEIYQKQPVKYYLIISPETEEVEVYEIVEGSYQLKQEGTAFTYSYMIDKECVADIDFKEIW